MVIAGAVLCLSGCGRDGVVLAISKENYTRKMTEAK